MIKEINTVALVGSGNVANHLGVALKDRGVNISGVFGRNEKTVDELRNLLRCKKFLTLDEIKADLVIVCVKDDAISDILEGLDKEQLVAYTSGSMTLNSLARKDHTGVFYPFQTFTAGKEVNMFEVPFFIEANDTYFAHLLFDLAWKLSRKVQFCDSENRKLYHLCGVWVNNFTNHIAFQAKDFTDKHDLDWTNLLPLLKETVDKIEKMNPYEAQTGPARRNDQATIQLQESMQHGIQKEIYSLLTKSIIETYKKA